MKLDKQLKRARRTIRFIWYHPLVRKNRMAAFLRYFKFHLYSLVDNTEKIIPFIEDTQLVISKDLKTTCKISRSTFNDSIYVFKSCTKFNGYHISVTLKSRFKQIRCSHSFT